MENLEAEGHFSPPLGSSLERVLDGALPTASGRVFVDLWDAEKFFHCDDCRQARIDRLHEMNLRQELRATIVCSECNE